MRLLSPLLTPLDQRLMVRTKPGLLMRMVSHSGNAGTGVMAGDGDEDLDAEDGEVTRMV